MRKSRREIRRLEIVNDVLSPHVRFATFDFEVFFFDDEALPVFFDDVDVPLCDFDPGDFPPIERLLDGLVEEDLPPAVLLLDRPTELDDFLPLDDEELFLPDEDEAFPPLVDFDDVDVVADERPADEALLREAVPDLLPLDREAFLPALPLVAVFAATIESAAAPTAPTAAPAAAPDMISPATSTTFSTIAEVVVLRLRDERKGVDMPLRGLLELDLLAIKFSLPESSY